VRVVAAHRKHAGTEAVSQPGTPHDSRGRRIGALSANRCYRKPIYYARPPCPNCGFVDLVLPDAPGDVVLAVTTTPNEQAVAPEERQKGKP